MSPVPHRIDVHHHLVPPAYVDALAAKGITEVAGRELPAWSPAISLELMNRHGIEVAVTSISAPGVHFGDPRFDELLAELDRRAAVVFVHPAVSTIAARIPLDIPVFAMEFTFDTTRAAFNLAYTGALERFPHICFIIAHAGGTVPFLAARFDLPWLQDAALVERAPRGGSAYLARLFYDTALSANPHALRCLAELVGPDRVLFGSDFPFAPELATGMQVAGLAAYEDYDDDARRLVERDNALELLPGLAARL